MSSGPIAPRHGASSHLGRAALALVVAVGAALSWWWARPEPGTPPTPGEAATAPRRVVLFGPNLEETAAVLGHGDKLVAVTDYCRWPATLLDRPRVGGALDPDLETLASLRPDLLVLQGESRVLRSFAAAQGLRVASVKMDDDVGSILAGVERLDVLLGGDGSRGRAVADSLRDELDALAALPAPSPRPSTLLVVSRDPDGLGNLLGAGRGTFLDELVTIAGGRSWAGERIEGYATISLEALAADPPTLVVEIVGGGEDPDPAGRRAPWSRLGPPLPAVRVLAFDGALVPGPRIVETARALRALVEEVGGS